MLEFEVFLLNKLCKMLNDGGGVIIINTIFADKELFLDTWSCLNVNVTISWCAFYIFILLNWIK